ncbi:hypothetical protein MLD38_002597 [Melastoma candidum]|uniref:Uncharacterized protein n=1 Tax=Melastoma candidum TaxID=119954 RepID=A0ACB9S0G9_9MYRT|nr:hypothetical protein MLD38_002597 [Melastoma candidum]
MNPTTTYYLPYFHHIVNMGALKLPAITCLVLVSAVVMMTVFATPTGATRLDPGVSNPLVRQVERDPTGRPVACWTAAACLRLRLVGRQCHAEGLVLRLHSVGRDKELEIPLPLPWPQTRIEDDEESPDQREMIRPSPQGLRRYLQSKSDAAQARNLRYMHSMWITLSYFSTHLKRC